MYYILKLWNKVYKYRRKWVLGLEYRNIILENSAALEWIYNKFWKNEINSVVEQAEKLWDYMLTYLFNFLS